MNQLKFYILVPVYKTEKYIRACLDSVVNQTFANFQTIIVDDGTPDGAGAICDEFAAKDGRFYVIHKENQGLISARRAAISYVKNNFDADDDYFVFLDSDDALNPNALQVIAETIQRENCDLLFFGMERVCEGKFVSAYENAPFTGTIINKRDLYKRVFSNAAYNPLCRKSIKCSLVKDEDYSRFYHISSAEDLLQSIPVYRDCEKAVFIPDVLYNYTVNPNSITQAVTVQNFKVDSTVRSAVWDFIQAQDVLTEEDKKDYASVCRKMLRDSIIGAAQLKTSKKEIMAIYERIKEDAYFSMLLNNDVDDTVLNHFQKGKYKTIITLVRARRLASRIYHFLRGK